MHLKFIFLLLAIALVTLIQAQEAMPRLSLTASVQFHSLGLPFQQMGGNFKNLGLNVGARFGWNDKGSLVQDLQLSWLSNRNVGNSWTLHTQLGWQPRLFNAVRFGPHLGLGYSWLQHPVTSFVQEDGEWVAQGQRGKGVLSVPVGLSLRLAKGWVQPFVAYQMLLYSDYNQGVPILPNTMLQIGSQISFH